MILQGAKWIRKKLLPFGGGLQFLTQTAKWPVNFLLELTTTTVVEMSVSSQPWKVKIRKKSYLFVLHTQHANIKPIVTCCVYYHYSLREGTSKQWPIVTFVCVLHAALLSQTGRACSRQYWFITSHIVITILDGSCTSQCSLYSASQLKTHSSCSSAEPCSTKRGSPTYLRCSDSCHGNWGRQYHWVAIQLQKVVCAVSLSPVLLFTGGKKGALHRSTGIRFQIPTSEGIRYVSRPLSVSQLWDVGELDVDDPVSGNCF